MIGQPDPTWGEIPLALVVLKQVPAEKGQELPGASTKGQEPKDQGVTESPLEGSAGVKAEGPTERELIAYVKTYVDRGVLPREAILLKVRFVPSLDKTSVGKVNKVALRKKYLG